jgi:predicted NBD/HSP70 family sugar kinase
MNQIFEYLVGIDWASDSYEVCVVDGGGNVLGKERFEHSGDGIRQCIDWLLHWLAEIVVQWLLPSKCRMGRW